MTASLFQGQRVLVDSPVPGTGRTGGRVRGTGLRRRWRARQSTGMQRAAGLAVAVVCVLACYWYVQQISHADSGLMTGSVTSTGIVNLNFAAPGVVGSVLVRVGEHVRKHELLATETTPGEAAVLAADAEAVTADKEQLAAQAGPASAIADDRAQLARDEARLAADHETLAQSWIVAPSAGVVTAVDVQPGQPAEPTGVREYVSQSAAVAPPPLFSLLPENPQVSSVPLGSASATLPVIQLRTSPSWEVLVLVPESSAASVRTGQPVSVSVPAASLTAIRGIIQELLATPVRTADGDMYEAIVAVTSRWADPPLDGMTANVTLDRRSG